MQLEYKQDFVLLASQDPTWIMAAMHSKQDDNPNTGAGYPGTKRGDCEKKARWSQETAVGICRFPWNRNLSLLYAECSRVPSATTP
ncbi:hypothetical protein EK904_008771 [Melospiza melodia maxima]|nr:hypothetical protein EK904_008771 [Melospiza melodia maxima]